MAYVYMIRCRGDRIYTGYAEDLEHRLKMHFSHAPEAAKFTKAFPPEELLAAWEVPDKSGALKMEAAIKKLSRKEKERLAAGDEKYLGFLEKYSANVKEQKGQLHANHTLCGSSLGFEDDREFG